jgi:hypothetical protein
MANKSVEAPKGFHWMKAGKGFKLMKDQLVDINHIQVQVKKHHLQCKQFIKGVRNNAHTSKSRRRKERRRKERGSD